MSNFPILLSSNNSSLNSSILSSNKSFSYLESILLSPAFVAVIVTLSVNLTLRYVDEKKRKESTLYYPLYIACKEILEVFKKYDSLGEKGCYVSLDNASKVFENISRDSIRYLNIDMLGTFLSIKLEVYRTLYDISKVTWSSLTPRFNTEYKVLSENADALLKECVRKVITIEKNETIKNGTYNGDILLYIRRLKRSIHILAKRK